MVRRVLGEEQGGAWAALAGAIAGRPRYRAGVWSGRRRKLEYSARSERDLTAEVPAAPAAVMLYDAHGTCRTLVLDVDVPGSEGTARTHEAVALLERCGGRVIVDRSPAGKHHVYVPLRDRLSVDEAMRLVRAIAARIPGVDVMPHAGAASGCIRPPGSTYKDGTGFQELVTPLDEARRCVLTRNGSDVLGRLERELSEELAQVARAQIQLVRPVEELEAEAGAMHAPLVGPVLSPRIAAIAHEGLWEQAGYPDRSRARMAVLCAARRAGMRHVDVVARLEDGRWSGLAAMFQNATTPWRRLLTHEWKKAIAFVGSGEGPAQSVRHCNTSEEEVTRGGPGGFSSTLESHRFVRTWRAVLLDVEREEFAGRGGIMRRFVLRALAAAAHEAGTPMVEFGVRSLSLSLPGTASTVARALVELRSADDPWIVLERDAEGTRADLYSLRIPDRHRARAKDFPLVAGKSHAMRPAFQELGVAAALVFEAIERGAGSVLAAATSSGVARSTTHEVIGELRAWGLVSLDAAGRLVAHPEHLGSVAERLGVLLVIARVLEQHRRERAAWRAWLARRGSSEAWWEAAMANGPPEEALAG